MAFNSNYIWEKRFTFDSTGRDSKDKGRILNKPSQALKIITLLNNKNKVELEEMKIHDRT